MVDLYYRLFDDTALNKSYPQGDCAKFIKLKPDNYKDYLVFLFLEKTMTYKEMNEIIFNAKAEFIWSERKREISFDKIGKKLNPPISRQAVWKILNTYFKKISA